MAQSVLTILRLRNGTTHFRDLSTYLSAKTFLSNLAFSSNTWVIQISQMFCVIFLKHVLKSYVSSWQTEIQW